MAKKVVEEPRYECDERIDGVKAYYYFNPPDLKECDKEHSEGLGQIGKGIVILVLTIVIRILIRKLVRALPAFLGTFVTWIVVAAVVIGIVFILIGVSAVKKAEAKKLELEAKIVSDKEYEAMENILLQDVMEKGMKYVNLDEDEIKEAEPLILHRYSGGKIHKGEDGKYRSTDHRSTVFYFTEDALFVYEYAFSLMNTAVDQKATTLFYSDIVSIHIEDFKIRSKSDAQKESKEESQEEILIGLKNLVIYPSSGISFSYSFIDSERIGTSIRAMQSLIGSKKRGN